MLHCLIFRKATYHVLQKITAKRRQSFAQSVNQTVNKPAFPDSSMVYHTHKPMFPSEQLIKLISDVVTGGRGIG